MVRTSSRLLVQHYHSTNNINMLKAKDLPVVPGSQHWPPELKFLEENTYGFQLNILQIA